MSKLGQQTFKLLVFVFAVFLADVNGKAIDDQQHANLHALIREGKVEAVRELLAGDIFLGAVNSANSTKSTPLHVACFYGKQAVIDDLLLKLYHDEIALNALNSDGETPLHLACRFGHPEAVRSLIEAAKKRGDTALKDLVDAQQPGTKYTAIFFAATSPYVNKGVVESVINLIENGKANVAHRDSNDMLAIHAALVNRRFDVLFAILPRVDKSVSQMPCCGENKNKTLSHLAAEYNVTELLANEWCQYFDANSKDALGQNPACWAARKGSVEFGRKMSELGINIEAGTCVYEERVPKATAKPLRTAAYNRRSKYVELLVKRELKLFRQHQLVHAAQDGDVALIRQLLEEGDIDVNYRDDERHTYHGRCFGTVENAPALVRTPWCGAKATFEIVKLLLDNGADVNAKETFSNLTALALASYYGQVDTVRLLLDRGAETDATCTIDGEPKTALRLAAEQNNAEIALLLLKNGAKRQNCKDLPLCTIETAELESTLNHRKLGQAAAEGNAEKIRQLLQEFKLDVNWRDERSLYECGQIQNATAIIRAACAKPCSLAVLRLLLERGADANAKEDFAGFTPLIFAAHGSNIELVRLLLDNGADINARDAYGETALIGAAEEDRSAAVAHLLLTRGASREGCKYPLCTMETADLETLALHRQLGQAAEEGNVELVRQILKQGKIDVNWKDPKSYYRCYGAICNATALIRATQCGNPTTLRVVKLLLEHGADVNAKDGDSGFTALSFAAHHDQVETVRVLLDHGADIDAEDQWCNGCYRHPGVRTTPLMRAVNMRGHDTVRLLTKRGARRNGFEVDNWELGQAASDGHVEIVRTLLTEGMVNVNWRDERLYDGCYGQIQNITALLRATHCDKKEMFEIVKLLLQHGANVNVRDEVSCLTPLGLAAYYGQVETVQLLLDHGAEINPKDTCEGPSRAPLLLAAYRNKHAVTRLLLDRNASRSGCSRALCRLDPAEVEESKRQAGFGKAAQDGNVKLLRIMLSKPGYDVNWEDDAIHEKCFGRIEHATAIVRAGQCGNAAMAEVMKLLVDNGAKVNAKERYAGFSALHFAAYHGNAEAVSLLLKLGADPNTTDTFTRGTGKTPFMRAAENGKTDVVRNFVDRREVPRGFKFASWRLGEAAAQGNLQLLRELLKDGKIDVNWKDELAYAGRAESCYGSVKRGTPLLRATQCKNDNMFEIVKLLIENGADLKAKEGSAGFTALAFAIEHRQLKLVKFLAEIGANVNAVDTYDGVKNTVLNRAAFYETDPEYAYHLIMKGASRDGCANYQCTRPNSELVAHVRGRMLAHAAVEGDVETVHQLLQLGGFDVNSKDAEPRSESACSRNYVEAPVLIRVLACNKNKTTMFEIFKLLLDSGADVNTAYIRFSHSALSLAAKLNELDVARLLLDRGANPNLKVGAGETPLANAAKYGSAEIVKLLLSKGATRDSCTLAICSKDEAAITKYALQRKLIISASRGNVEQVRDLLKKGSVDVNFKDDISNVDDDCNGLALVSATALLRAAQCCSNETIYETVTTLFENGADVNAVDERTGLTALILAAENGQLDTVWFLLDRGADINAKDTLSPEPQTALMRAAKKQHVDVVALLLARGASREGCKEKLCIKS